MKKKFLSILLTGVLVLSMASCGNSNSNNQTTKSPENQTQTQMQGSDNQTVGDNFTYPMEPVTLTINGSGDGGTKFYDDSLHPAWAKDIYMHKVMRDETGVTLEDVGGAAGSTTMSEQFLLMLASGELPDIMIAWGSSGN